MTRPAILLLLALTATMAAADDGDPWWLSAGLGAGVLSLDAHLADYRWDTTPQATYGAQALVGRGRLAGGLRLSRAQTTQGTGLEDGTAAPTVALTDLVLVVQARLVTVAGVELWGSAQGGRLHVGYAPDRLTVDLGGEATTVVLEPIDEWIAGLGLELRHRFGRHLDLAVQVGWSSFALDTAHRSGDEIVEDRERFDCWDARLLVAWTWNLT